MIVAYVDPTGKRRWVDYIPVQEVVCTAANADTYNDAGGKVSVEVSPTGLTPWVDYIPVVAENTDGWRSDDDGYTPICLTAGGGGGGGGSTVDFVIGEATDASARGYHSYTEAASGVPGAPLGSLTPGTIAGFEVRELSWDTAGAPYFYLALTDGGSLPAGPFFTSLSFTDDSDVVWTLTDADSNVPGGADGSFDGEDIKYWVWNTDWSQPDITPDATYVLTVVTP